MLNHISIGKRLTGGFLIATLITLVTGLASLSFLNSVSQAGLFVGKDAAPRTDAVMEAKFLATEAHLHFEELMGGDPAESIEGVRKLMNEAQWYLDALAKGGENQNNRYVAVVTPGEKALLAQAQASFSELQKALESRYLTLGKNNEAERHKVDADFDTRFEAYVKAMEDLEADVDREMKTALDGLDQTIARSKTALIALVGAALALGLLIGNLLKNSITRPLSACVGLAREVKQGNLTVRIQPEGSDEIAELVNALETMRGHLQTMIGEMRGDAIQLKDAASSLAAAAEQSRASSLHQSDAASSMAASVEEMSVSIDQIGDHAREANAVAGESGQQSVESGRIIHDAVNGMNEIANTVNATANTIRQLEDVSSQISVVVNVIREIAEQTNLLALNAAIEAARAGEQGRGFAVVADEVRKLAERTSTSTGEISAMIDKIQQGTQRAVAEMGTGVDRSNEGVRLAGLAGESMTRIHDSAQRVTNVVSDITSALLEQSSSTREIAGRVEQIAQSAEQNSAAVSATAESARAVAGLAARLEQLTSGFRTA